MLAIRREQQHARRAEATGGEDNDTRLLTHALAARQVDVDGAVGPAALIGRDLLDARERAQLDALLQRTRPVRARHHGDRATRAAVAAGAAAVAANAPIVVFGDDRVIRWPPVPAEPL